MFVADIGAEIVLNVEFSMRRSGGGCDISCLTRGDSTFVDSWTPDSWESGSSLTLSLSFVFLAVPSFFDFVTRFLLVTVRFRFCGSWPSIDARNREYRIRAAWPLVISCVKIGS